MVDSFFRYGNERTSQSTYVQINETILFSFGQINRLQNLK